MLTLAVRELSLARQAPAPRVLEETGGAAGAAPAPAGRREVFLRLDRLDMT